MSPARTLGALRPMEAYRALSRFAGRRGHAAMRLAMHAAVPQSFRADLLHLLKLNFVPEAADDPAVEADVLLAPFSDDLGGGYFQFDPEVRRLLLDELGDTYADEPVLRVRRVADFLLAWVDRVERRAPTSHDRLGRDFLDTQRWVALAFARPESAAEQLAEALQKAEQAATVEARLHLGGLARAVAIPLAHHRNLLDYALALHALETGDRESAADLLEPLPPEFEVGSFTLTPARVQPPRRPAVPEPVEATQSTDASPEYRTMKWESAEPAEPALRKMPLLSVFISSSPTGELRSYHEKAVAVCVGLGLYSFWVTPHARLDHTLERLGQSDLFLCIVGGEYGPAPRGEDRSLMEIEYDHAVSAGIPVFTFVVDDEGIRADGDQARLNAFKQKVLNGPGVRLTSNPEDFASRVHSALQGWKDLRLESEEASRAATSAEEAAPAKPLRQIYLSHGPRERAFAERLRHVLRAAGLEVWMDLIELDVSHRDARTVAPQQVVIDADAMILVLDDDTFARGRLGIDARLASAADAPVFAALRGVRPADVPREIAPQRIVDFSDDESTVTPVDALLGLLGVSPADNAGLAPLYGVPTLPQGLVGRERELEKLRRLVLANDPSTTVIVGPRGVGKTALATVLAHDESVRRRYADGILWVRGEPGDDVYTVRARIVEALGARGSVESFLSSLSCLLVLDGSEIALPTLHLHALAGPRGHVLVTATNPDLVPLEASVVSLAGLSQDDAMRLLAQKLEIPVEQLPSKAGSVADAVVYVPWALVLAARLVREGASWSDLLHRLQNEGLRALVQGVAPALEERLGEMPEGAVYISYCSDDWEAAGRLHSSLQEVTEVWLDRDYLVGGDDWELKIRRNISRCSLFIPVLSRNAASREYGYFRVEWDAAVRRRSIQAKNLPFILPVIVDDLPVAAVGVPRAFWDAHATILPDGEVTPEFQKDIISRLRTVRSALRSGGLTDLDRDQGTGLSRQLGEQILRDRGAHDLSLDPEFAIFQFLGYSVSRTAVEFVALCDADGLTESDIARRRDEFFDVVRKVPHEYGLQPRGRNPNGLLGFVFARGCPPEIARFIAKQTRISHATGNSGMIVSWVLDIVKGQIHTHDNPVSIFPPVIVAPKSVYPGLEYLRSLFPNFGSASGRTTSDDAETVNVLIFGSSPDNNPLELDREVRTVRETVGSNAPDRVVVNVAWTVRMRDVRRALLEHQPSIVHFSGQGTKSNGIVLDNDSGEAYVLPGEELESVFHLFAYTIQCVVLNLCWSDVQARAIAQHVSYVVGTRAESGDDAGLAFASAFYRAIAAGKDVPSAFQFGAAGMQLEGYPETSPAPMLVMRQASPNDPAST